jgi:hypothetical protein
VLILNVVKIKREIQRHLFAAVTGLGVTRRFFKLSSKAAYVIIPGRGVGGVKRTEAD